MNFCRISLLVLTFLMFDLPKPVHAQNTKTLDECFATYGETSGELLFCVTSAVTKQEEIRGIIEADFITIIKGDTYLPPPKLKEYVPPKSKKKANEEEEIKKAEQQALRNKKRMEQYKAHKRKLVSKFKKSIDFFEVYRDAECLRREERFKLQKDAKMAALTEQVCLHELTKQRIRSMEASAR